MGVRFSGELIILSSFIQSRIFRFYDEGDITPRIMEGQSFGYKSFAAVNIMVAQKNGKPVFVNDDEVNLRNLFSNECEPRLTSPYLGPFAAFGLEPGA